MLRPAPPIDAALLAKQDSTALPLSFGQTLQGPNKRFEVRVVGSAYADKTVPGHLALAVLDLSATVILEIETAGVARSYKQLLDVVLERSQLIDFGMLMYAERVDDDHLKILFDPLPSRTGLGGHTMPMLVGHP